MHERIKGMGQGHGQGTGQGHGAGERDRGVQGHEIGAWDRDIWDRNMGQGMGQGH
jgi:hypothetical protein